MATRSISEQLTAALYILTHSTHHPPPTCHIILTRVKTINPRVLSSSSPHHYFTTTPSSLPPQPSTPFISMEAPTLRQRPESATSKDDQRKAIRETKLLKARRGLRSLAVAVALPLIFSVLSSFLSPPLRPKTDEASLLWFPPASTLHVAAAASAGLMGLAGWLVWAEGGMRAPAPAALFAAQLVLGLAWAPLAHAGWAGLALGAAKVAVLVGCARCFRRANPFSGNLVGPCIAWAAFLVLLSYRMM